MSTPLPSSSALVDEAKRVLFQPRPVRAITEPTAAPLGELSNYVVTRLPVDLSAVQAGELPYSEFASKVSNLAENMSDARLVELQCDTKRADIASLDANFLVAAAFHAAPDEVPAGERVPSELQRLARSLARATCKIPIPSYEDLIFINPLEGDVRVFSHGPAASAERDFYLAHRLIERCFDAAIANLDICLDSLFTENADAANAALVEATGYFDSAADILRLLGARLVPETFRGFRRYFFTVTFGQRQYVGASGRYTTGLPIIETLVADAKFLPPVPPELDVSNDENLRSHFPRSGLRAFDARVIEAINGRSLGRSIDSHRASRALIKSAKVLCQSILRFRKGHLWAVKRQIDEAGLDAPVAGTGGVTDIRAYFDTRIAYKYIAFSGDEGAPLGGDLA
jgi:hypothetical protein